MELKIEYVDINSIKPYARNAKKHPRKQLEQIKKSIIDFGFNDPIGIWNNEIVEGHGRYLAAKELGMQEIPVIKLDDLNDEQRRAYALIHNKLTMNSGFDVDLLNQELENIGFDMSSYDFEISQSLSDNEEINVDDYGDDKFKCTCPSCNFKFNPKE